MNDRCVRPFGLLLALLALVAQGCGGGGETPRNLLLISIDTLRADALGSYGSERGATHGLDEFAEGAVRFASVWATSPKTAPSHMTMLTGLPSGVHGVGNANTAGAGKLSPRATTLAEILLARGFATAGFTDGANVSRHFGFERGFESFQDKAEAFEEKAPRLRRWLREQGSSGERWFAFLHTYDVHDPYFSSAAARKRFDDPAYAGRVVGDRKALERSIAGGEDLAPNAKGQHKTTNNFWLRAKLSDPLDQARLRELYLAGIWDLDRKLGALLRELDAEGLLEDTAVVITADHGEEFGEHGMSRHEQLWREVLHVPLLVRLPGGRGAGLAIEASVSQTDLVPSLLELLDVADPRGVQFGRSWAGWIDDPASATSAPVYAEHRSKRDRGLDLWSVRSDGWLLHQDREGVRALRDMGADPAELAQVEDPARVAELEGERRQLLAEIARAAPRFAPLGGLDLDAEALADLRALGYLGDQEGPGGGGDE